MDSFIPNGNEEYEDIEQPEVVIPRRQDPIGQVVYPLGEATLSAINDIQNIEGVEQRPVDLTSILAGNQHIEDVNRHYFNIIMDKTIPFHDLIVQRDRIESILPFNEQVFSLEWKEGPSGRIPYQILNFSFKYIQLEMVKKTAELRRQCFCSQDVYDTCLMYRVINSELEDSFWIVYLKLMKFIPAIIRNDLQKKIYDTCQLERKIKQINEVELQTPNMTLEEMLGNKVNRGYSTLSTSLFDIQVNNVNLENYCIEGFKCERDKNIVTPFFLQIIKTDIKIEIESGERQVVGNRYYILTNLYNQEDEKMYDVMKYQGDIETEELVKMKSTEIGNIQYTVTEPMLIIEENIPRYQMNELQSKEIGKLEEVVSIDRANTRVIDGTMASFEIDNRKRIYYKDKNGITRWKINPKYGQMVARPQRKFKFADKIKVTRQTPYVDLHFAITIPYMPDYEEMYPEVKPYILTKNDFLTLIYELSLINGEQLIQLPEIKQDEKGIFMEINENMPGLETVEGMEERQNAMKEYEKQMMAQQAAYNQAFYDQAVMNQAMYNQAVYNQAMYNQMIINQSMINQQQQGINQGILMNPEENQILYNEQGYPMTFEEQVQPEEIFVQQPEQEAMEEESYKEQKE